MNQFNIMFGGLSCRFLINGRIAHSIGANTISAPLTLVLTLPFRHNVVNNTAVNRSIFSRGTSFKRLSPVAVAPRYVNISTATTTVVRVGAGTLRAIVANTPTGNVTIYDNTAASGTKIGTIVFSSAAPLVLQYGLEVNTGITIVTSAAADITVVFD